MESGFRQSVNNVLLDNLDENIPITNSASIPVMNHQCFKGKINSFFEKHNRKKKKSMVK